MLKVFTIYRCGGHLGHVTMTIFTKFMFSLLMKVVGYETQGPSPS